MPTGPRPIRSSTISRLQAEQAEVETLRRRVQEHVEAVGSGGRQRLAVAMGVSPAWISHLLSGRTHSVSFTALRRAAQAMDLSLPDLLIETGTVSREDLSPQEWSALRQLIKLQAALKANAETKNLVLSPEGQSVVADEEARVRRMAEELFRPTLRRSDEVVIGELQGLTFEGRAILIQCARMMKRSHVPSDPRDSDAERCPECQEIQAAPLQRDEVCGACTDAIAAGRRYRPAQGRVSQ